MERLKSSLRKFYGRYWDPIKHYVVYLSQMLHDILGHGHVQWHPQLIRHNTNFRTYYRTGLYYRFWPYYQNFGGFHRTLQRVRLANRGRVLLRTPGPVPFGTCICSNVETILSWTCHVYGPFEFRTSLGTLFCYLNLSVHVRLLHGKAFFLENYDESGLLFRHCPEIQLGHSGGVLWLKVRSKPLTQNSRIANATKKDQYQCSRWTRNRCTFMGRS